MLLHAPSSATPHKFNATKSRMSTARKVQRRTTCYLLESPRKCRSTRVSHFVGFAVCAAQGGALIAALGFRGSLQRASSWWLKSRKPRSAGTIRPQLKIYFNNICTFLFQAKTWVNQPKSVTYARFCITRDVMGQVIVR